METATGALIIQWSFDGWLPFFVLLHTRRKHAHSQSPMRTTVTSVRGTVTRRHNYLLFCLLSAMMKDEKVWLATQLLLSWPAQKNISENNHKVAEAEKWMLLVQLEVPGSLYTSVALPVCFAHLISFMTDASSSVAGNKGDAMGSWLENFRLGKGFTDLLRTHHRVLSSSWRTGRKLEYCGISPTSLANLAKTLGR